VATNVIGMAQCLKRFGKAIAAAELAEQATAQASAVEIAETARSLAPVDSGYLRDHIAVTESGVHVDTPYAAAVEYGNPHHPAAQPYVRPAMDEANEEAPARVGRLIMRGV
jgi:HK97 gp10 family phage protein